MTWTASGTIISTTSSSLTVNPAATGNLVLAEVISLSATVYATSISGGNCTWTQVGSRLTDSGETISAVLFAGKATSTGSASASISWSGATPGIIRIAGQQFHSSAGAWALDGSQGNLDNFGSNSNWPTLTPSSAGELYFGYVFNESSATAGATSGFTYQTDPDANGLGYALSVSSAYTPVWGDTGENFGICVLMQETGATQKARIISQAVNRAATY